MPSTAPPHRIPPRECLLPWTVVSLSSGQTPALTHPSPLTWSEISKHIILTHKVENFRRKKKKSGVISFLRLTLGVDWEGERRERREASHEMKWSTFGKGRLLVQKGEGGREQCSNPRTDWPALQFSCGQPRKIVCIVIIKHLLVF